MGVAMNASRLRCSAATRACSARAACSRASTASRSRRSASRSSALLNTKSPLAVLERRIPAAWPGCPASRIEDMDDFPVSAANGIIALSTTSDWRASLAAQCRTSEENLTMAYDIAADPRLDPRLKTILAGMPAEAANDVDSREVLLAEANTEAARHQAELFRSFMDLCDTEEAAPSARLRVHSEKVVSAPDGNTISLQVIRPDSEETLACVYYIHGGGMASLSCYDRIYRGWGKIIAANGVAAIMVDFRNAVTASSVPEVAPFPAGLNDCVSGLRWVIANAARLNIDPARVIVAGASGGGD